MIPAGKKKEDAQLTVMMSLLILILLTFTAGILESASIQTSKNIRRADTERAVESLFAEYQKELLEEYDLFGLDGTYETGNYSEERVIEPYNRIWSGCRRESGGSRPLFE